MSASSSGNFRDAFGDGCLDFDKGGFFGLNTCLCEGIRDGLQVMPVFDQDAIESIGGKTVEYTLTLDASAMASRVTSLES